MYARMLTFRGATDIDGGIAYLRDEAVPLLQAQHGYRAVMASASRTGALLSILSLWDTEADRAASDNPLGKSREEARKIIGGELTVENYEQLVEMVTRRPEPGCGLFVMHVSMDPGSVDENLAYFVNEIAPRITARPGFCTLRCLGDRQSGRSVVGSVWMDQESMDGAVEDFEQRRATSEGRGIHFDEVGQRELLFVDRA